MPSVDVVSKVDLQTLDNAINNVKREISTRFDFKNVKSEITYDRKAKNIHIVTGDDWKVKAVSEMLIIEYLTVFILSKLTIDSGYFLDLVLTDFVSLVSKALSHFLKEIYPVYKLYLTFPLRCFIIG